MEIEKINEKQKDALKELGNIGAAHAATALSQLLGHKIEMSVPQVNFVEKTHLENCKKFKDSNGVSIYTDVYGKLEGKILIFFEYSNSVELVKILLNDHERDLTSFTPVEESALKEVGNILASSYLNAISLLIDGVLLPSVPKISIDTLKGILDYFALKYKGVIQNALWIETELRSDKYRISGDFFLFPKNSSLDEIFKALRVD